MSGESEHFSGKCHLLSLQGYNCLKICRAKESKALEKVLKGFTQLV